METILIVINIIFLITFITYTRYNNIRYGNLISNRRRKLFNIILFILFIIYVVFHTYCIYMIQPITVSIEQLRENKDSLRTSGDKLFQALMFLIISPIFWITLFNFYKEFTDTFFNKKFINSDKNTMYYRGTLKNVSPGLISFVLEHNIDISKTLTASILKLKLEGCIAEEKNKLVCLISDTTKLSTSEQILINAINTGIFSQDEYLNSIEKEALQLKILSKYQTKFKKVIKILLNTIPRIIILILLICSIYFLSELDKSLIDGVLIFTNYDFVSTDSEDNYYKARYIQVDEDLFNELKEKREEEISILVEKELEREKKNETEPKHNSSDNTYWNIPEFNISSELQANLKKSEYRMQDLKEQIYFTNILGDHYIKASHVSVGIVSLDLLISIVQASSLLLSFLCIVSVINIIRFIIVSNKYSSNKYLLTNKGLKLRKEILGLKKYLKDYSLIQKRSEEEVLIWEYYLIYAVVIHENFDIEDKIIKKFVRQIYR